MSPGRRWHLPRRRRSRVLASLVVVLVIAGGVTAGLTLSSSTSAQYRTVAASIGTVEQTLSLTGTVEPVHQADLNFATSGTVASVDVAVGQTVREGEEVATLDPASLTAQVDQARAALDNAELTLRTAQSPSGSIIATDQNAVANARQSLDADRASLEAQSSANEIGLTQAQQTLESAETSESSESVQLQDDEGALAAAQAKASVDCQGDALAGSTACATDQSTITSDTAKVASDQSALNAAQNAVQSASQSLTTTQQKNTTSLAQAQQVVTSAESQLATAQATLSTASNGSYADQLASDNASVASAESSLQTAERNLSDTHLLAPISGTVVAVNTAVGDNATVGSSSLGTASATSSSSSSSSSAAVEIINPHTFEVAATASDSQIPDLKTGQRALISAAGTTPGAVGTVTQVGTIATVTSGVATFPVTIGVSGMPTGLYAGTTANVTIVQTKASNVLTVPSSAVHTVGPRSFVDVLTKGKEVLTPVSVGAVSTLLTQITSGLKAGEQIVLAVVSSSIPSTSSSSTSSRFGGFGGAGGAGGAGVAAVALRALDTLLALRALGADERREPLGQRARVAARDRELVGALAVGAGHALGALGANLVPGDRTVPVLRTASVRVGNEADAARVVEAGPVDPIRIRDAQRGPCERRRNQDE